MPCGPESACGLQGQQGWMLRHRRSQLLCALEAALRTLGSLEDALAAWTPHAAAAEAALQACTLTLHLSLHSHSIRQITKLFNHPSVTHNGQNSSVYYCLPLLLHAALDIELFSLAVPPVLEQVRQRVLICIIA